MKSKLMKRIVSMMLVMMMAIAMVPATAYADDTPQEVFYEETNAYQLNFGTRKYGPYRFEYSTPYNPLLRSTYGGEEAYAEYTGVNRLYNKANTSEYISVYCVDEITGLGIGYDYKRINLEESDFFDDDAAAKLRSITLNGFPKNTVEELGAAAGVENLTVGVAAHATQLAIWQTSYGEDLVIEDFVHQFYDWFTFKGYKPLVANYSLCMEEVNNGYATEENKEQVVKDIEAVFNYLMNLEPTAPQELVVSDASFLDWIEEPVVTDNGDGTFDVAVWAKVEVVENEERGDVLTLTAVLGDHFATVDLVNGEQTVELVIENVPAELVNNKVTLAIDGQQAVEDAFMFVTEGGREAQQDLIGYCGYKLPVHAEIEIEPERVVKFHKTDKVVMGTDLAGETIYDYIPLEGITFDLYLVAEWDAYVNGQVVLPDMEDLDVKEVCDPVYGYPDYTVVTDENGDATVSLTKNNLKDGVYVVVEREHIAIEKALDPFYIMLPYMNETGDGWEYELTVNPKNDVRGEIEIVKDVIEIDNNLASVDAYTNHTWIISTTVPVDIAVGKQFIIADTLDNRLDYVGNVLVQVEYTKTAEDDEVEELAEIVPVVLDVDTDYVLTVVDNDSLTEEKLADSFTIELTKAGMEKVGDAIGEQCDDYMIRVYFDAQINANAAMGEMIPNKATLKYINSVNFNFDKESDIPEVYTCGINVFKKDAKTEAPLAGAIFKVARLATEEEIAADEAVALVTAEGVVQVVYVDFFANRELTGDKVNQVISDETGSVFIYGLQELYEMQEVEGRDELVKTTLPYYLVEIKAPSGYNLLSYPVEMELHAASHTAEDLAEGQIYYAIEVANSNTFVLPTTGGIGTTIFTLAGALMMGGAGVILVSKKRNEEE